MKRLLLILILTLSFHSLTKADDIRDFQIEGMSVGDNLLDHVSKKVIGSEITSEYAYWYKQNKFVAISLWDKKDSFNRYEDVGVTIKPDDYKNYEIFSLYGKIWFENKNINECYNKQNEIYADIKNSFFDLVIKEKDWIVPKKRVASHLLSIKYRDLFFIDGKIRVVCYERTNGRDLLQVVINQNEFIEYLQSIASDD
ncbi:hypothetical protein [Candidatus Pelagibacter sp. Uisw_134_02]|uniref:hypothetical protein n=1 Tax=Candidatus Pelagibacter sp. Uisw_134_02 TaxID=3230990 RepID=UPI0039E8FCE8